jgi:hypothetical protein
MLKVRKIRNEDRWSLKWHDRENNIMLLSIHDTEEEAYQIFLEFMENMVKMEELLLSMYKKV